MRALKTILLPDVAGDRRELGQKEDSRARRLAFSHDLDAAQKRLVLDANVGNRQHGFTAVRCPAIDA